MRSFFTEIILKRFARIEETIIYFWYFLTLALLLPGKVWCLTLVSPKRKHRTSKRHFMIWRKKLRANQFPAHAQFDEKNREMTTEQSLFFKAKVKETETALQSKINILLPGKVWCPTLVSPKCRHWMSKKVAGHGEPAKVDAFRSHQFLQFHKIWRFLIR